MLKRAGLLAILICACMFLLVAGWTTRASASQINIELFEEIPVLHDGRIKPMQSFARALKKRISGRDRGAMPWLIEALFNPALSEKVRTIKISNNEVVRLLELPRYEDELYSYTEVNDALKPKQDLVNSIMSRPEEEWTKAQTDLMMLQQNVLILRDLLGSLTLFLPFSYDLSRETSLARPPEILQTHNTAYLLRPIAKGIKEQASALLEEHRDRPEDLTPEEKALLGLSFAQKELAALNEGNDLFKVIPDARQTYISPWVYYYNHAEYGPHEKIMALWQDLATSYHNQELLIINSKLEELVNNKNKEQELSVLNRINIELIYNDLQLFYLSCLFYLFAFTLLLINLFKENHRFRKISVYALSSGVLLHIIGIAMRIYILERPPVSTLYESVIFVGVVSVIYSLWTYWRQRHDAWLLIAALLGIVIHLIGFSHDQEGDSFLMLSAVLNTNFWLTAHVLCITTGYALCLVASGIAHYMLAGQAFFGTRTDMQISFKSLHLAGLLALLFTAVGTVLGGIWADQSWGRFWGWDPKENGALLIVLWLIWLLHGRITQELKPLLFKAGIAYLSVIVSVSWFGVNLLNVGLHSYGFTEGLGYMLAAFIIAETVVVAALVLLAKKNETKAYSP